MTPEFFDLIKNVGLPIALLVTALVTVVRGDWIPKKSHDREVKLISDQLAEEKEEKREWKHLALRGLNAAETSVEVSKVALVRERQNK